MKSFKTGLIVILVLGLIGWFLNGITSFIVNLLNKFLLLILPDKWVSPLAGLILAVLLAWLLGRLLISKSVDNFILRGFQKIPIIGKIWGLLKNIQQGVEEIKHSPCILVEYRGPGRLDLGFLRKVGKEQITDESGNIIEENILCWVYIPSANNPTSGSIPVVKPEFIKAVITNDFSEVMAYIVTNTVSRPRDGWKLRKFKLEEFLNLENPPSK